MIMTVLISLSLSDFGHPSSWASEIWRIQRAKMLEARWVLMEMRPSQRFSRGLNISYGWFSKVHPAVWAYFDEPSSLKPGIDISLLM
jgi:hypothetical protein